MQQVSSPSRLGRYPVRRRIGAGAFATVWLAYDEQLDSPVAIKVLAENWTQDLHVRQRFLEEGRFLRKVESAHVVSVYDAGELADDRPFLVMSYADQGTLADRLELCPVSPSQAVHVVAQVGEGLAALHRRGVLHRDVKPANVLFRSIDGDVGGPGAAGPRVSAMVGDLGLGKAMDMSSRLTMIGGTPSYVAPEQARGEGLDPRADQYSLAALTYLLLEGRPAYQHPSLAAASEPGPPPPMGADVPAGVEDVVRRGLAADRAHRYPDVRSFVGALREAMGDRLAGGAPEAWIPLDPELTQAGARPSTYVGAPDRPADVPPVREARRRPWRWLAAAVAALAVGVGTGYVVRELAVDQVQVTDAMGTLTVQVPETWTEEVQVDPWTPPDQDLEFPALALGDAAGWQQGDGSGVFVGLLPGSDLPEQVPQHEECGDQRPPVTDEADGDTSVTVVFTGCEGDAVTVERVVSVTSDQLLWVQVRADSRSVANQVLDAVELHGM